MRDRYGSIIGARSRVTLASASGMWTMREHAYEVASSAWPPYDPIISTNPAAYWDFSDPVSLRISGGATAPTSANSGSQVSPQDKSVNGLHLSQWNQFPTWFTGMQNGRSGGSFGFGAQIVRNAAGASIFTSLHRAQTTIVFVFWPGSQGVTTPAESNQTVMSTTGTTTPSANGTGIQINYLNAPFTGPSSAISFLASNNGTAVAAATTTSLSVPRTRFSIITIVTDIANATANERVKIYVDGGGTTYAGNVATGAANQFSPIYFFLGSGSPSSFRVGQIAFWETMLSASNLNAIHSALGDFWGIPVTSFS